MSCACMPSIVNDTSPPLFSASGGPDEVQARHLLQAGKHVGGQLALVIAHVLHAECLQVVDCRAESDRLGDRRRAGLELVGQLVPGGAFEIDRRDHVAAGEEGLHLIEDLGAAVQHADACRAERLVAGPGVEVGADRGGVHGHVGHGLCAVDQRQRAGRAYAGDHLRGRQNRAEHVGDVGEGHQLHVALGQLAVELIQGDFAPVVHLQIAQLCALALHSCCQGTMLAWCSICVVTIASPSPTLARPQA